MMADPIKIVQILGSSLIMAAVMYLVVNQVITTQNISGGLWSLGIFLLSVIPVAAAVMYIFA